MARVITTVRMWTKENYSKVVARLSEDQVHMLDRTGVSTEDLDIIMERNGGMLCSGVSIDPSKFPEAVKFTIQIESFDR